MKNKYKGPEARMTEHEDQNTKGIKKGSERKETSLEREEMTRSLRASKVIGILFCRLWEAIGGF